jgi:16S rRNA (uracil1498-N3)-methyltransferase
LAFAPIKKSPLEMLVTKATELGAERLLPVLTRRTVVGHVQTPRMRQHAIEAAEQCDRLTVPAIADAVALPDFLATWPPQRCLFVLDPDSETRIGDAICRRDADPDAAMPGFLVGPEGGWDASELDAFACLPFVTRVSLGPRILRAETAAVAALASWQALAGDW